MSKLAWAVNDPEVVADLAQRISAYQIALALNSPSTRRVGPFYARFDPRNPNPFGNYAIPEPGATPSTADVATLVRAYRKQERKPRLEYIAASAPAVERALLIAGFVPENRPALMACMRGAARHLLPPEGIILMRPSSDGDILAVSAVQREAFGEASPAGPADVDSMRAHIQRGAIVVLASEGSTGEAAGAGECTPLEGGVTEIVGIGVRQRFRRRGIASAVTARLAMDSFDRGATLAWLTPGDEDAQRIYTRAGFQPIAEMLMISLPN